MGDLLQLRFESRVGLLPDYFLYSSPKPPPPVALPLSNVGPNGLNKRAKEPEVARLSHSKRSLSALDSPLTPSDPGLHRKFESEQGTQPTTRADPVVERFHRLKIQYREQQEDGSIQRRKRSDLQAEIIRSMEAIERQELRQRAKKRAPVLDPDPETVAMKRRRGRRDEPKDNDEQADMEQNGEDEEEQVTEQDQDEDTEFEPGSADENEDTDEENEEEGESEGESEYQPQGEEQPEDNVASALGIPDPGFHYQWHLHNSKNGNDINVTGVWEQGINGTGINVAIIDDGLDMTSEDLAPNFFKEGSWDFNDNNPLPMPRLVDDQHGTRCAGEIAAVKNDLCGVGVAYGAKVAGLRILSGQITDVDEAAALNYRFQDNHIYSCSWGPPDDGKSMDAPKGVVLDAMINGIKNGRSGLGSIYVFATGNGGSQDDDCNFDGYTNSLYTVSIGAIDRAGRHPYYSEACSAQLAVTYSNGGGSAIYTCDVGKRRCFSQHGGTSAAAPIAAGMIALVLSIRPDLGWRDVQYLLMTTAVPVSLGDPDWKPTAAGRLFNHKFGYGSLDAFALVEAAKTFQRLGPQTFMEPPVVKVGRKLPLGGKGISSTLSISLSDRMNNGVEFGTLEHITVTVNIEHERRGDVEVILKSPKNIESKLGVRRRYDTATTGFVDWTFMTVKHWDEDPHGVWTLTVRDQGNPNFSGKFVDWRIKFWGEVRRQTANIEAKPSPNANAGEEQVLNEAQAKPEDPTSGQEDNAKINANAESGISAHDEPLLDKEPLTEMSQGTVGENGETGQDDMHEQEGEQESVSGDQSAGSASKARPWRDGTQAIPAETVAEADAEAEASLIAGRTLYLFAGALVLGAALMGLFSKWKKRGRGRYTGLGSSFVLGREFEHEDDGDIGLLPRAARESRTMFSSETQRENEAASNAHALKYDSGSDTDEDDFVGTYTHTSQSTGSKNLV
ncbi:pheromone processing endoprotease [Mortierella alpina]|uniref:Pheromone processing endoprotease n=1 Tax=Mortierella alpina TaxID=64518 RepID=A0A9P6LZD8_MORAP|nr:pheromone processing endoprotease [Mortierella alpina]